MSTTTPATVTLLRSELLDDIGHLAWLEADAMPQEAEHARHMLRDILQDANADRVTRTLVSAAAWLADMLLPLTKMPYDDATTLDDTLVDNDCYILRLNLPETYPQTSAELLNRLAHNFLVYSVLAPWLAMCNPQRGQYYYALLDKLRDRLRDLANRGDDISRRPMFPASYL